MPRDRPYTGKEEERELALIVEHLRAQVRARSLRAVAREVGMSPTGLRGVLEGTQPYGKTRDSLRGWFARERGLDELPPAAAEDTLLALTRGLREPARVALEVLDVIADSHTAASGRVPAWVRAVRVRLGGRG